MVNLRHLARDGLTNRFIGLDYDTGLLTVHNTLIRHLHIMRLCRMCGAQQEPSAHVV